MIILLNGFFYLPHTLGSSKFLPTSCDCIKGCFAFRFIKNACAGHAIQHATLKVRIAHQKPRKLLRQIKVEEVKKDGSLIYLGNTTLPEHLEAWISLDVMKRVKEWFKSPRNKTEIRKLKVSCENCETVLQFSHKTTERPFIIIKTGKSMRKKRIRRSLDCLPDSKVCCRKQFYVSFKKIKWDDWIIQPTGFQANYCEGSCTGHAVPSYAHSTILQRMNDKEFPLCCVATNMKPLSLLYFGGDGLIFKREIKDMMVERCGCS